MMDESAATTLKTRPAVESDREAVSALLAQSKLAVLDERAQFGDQYVVAFDLAGELIGAAGVEVYGASGLLRSVVVSKQARSKGIGKHLFLDRLSWAHRQGITRLFLLTTDARSYWMRQGFQEIGRTQVPEAVQASSQWGSGSCSSAIAMVRSLVDSNVPAV